MGYGPYDPEDDPADNVNVSDYISETPINDNSSDYGDDVTVNDQNDDQDD